MRLTAAHLSLLLLFACATTSMPDRAKYLADATAKYPSDGFIVGYGFGETPEIAEERARVSAAESISSEITSNTKILDSQQTANGSTKTDLSVVSEIVKRVQSNAGALVHAQRELTREARGGFEAIAVANRDELDAKYAAELGPMLDRLESQWDRALAAGDDAGAAAAALCESDALEKKLEDRDLERRLVTRRTVWSDSATAKRRQVAALRQKVKSNVDVQVVADDKVVPVNASDQFVGALVGAGYTARTVTAAQCDAKTLVLELRVEPNCGRQAALGGSVMCKTTYRSTASKCGDSRTIFAVASDPGVGLHSNDQAIAERQALNKADVPRFSRVVLARLLEALGEGCSR